MDGSDLDLLNRYVEGRDEVAFTELVRRHASMVYGAALRQTGNPHQAQEVTQAVFLLLVRKAPGMNDSVVLGSWLFRAAQYAANDLRKAQRRRAARETAMDPMPDLPDPSPDGGNAAWQPYLPHLDRCLARLPDPDQRALWLRFFEDKSLAEVGRALGVAEEAARKRVRRALDRLQGLLVQEGAEVREGDLEPMLGARQAALMPVGLVDATVAAVFSGGSAGMARQLADGVARHWAWQVWKPWVLATSALVSVTAGVQALRTPTLVEPQVRVPVRDDYSAAGFPRPEPVGELVLALQQAILRKDVAAAAALMRFPLRVNTPAGVLTVSDATALAANWERVFPRDVSSLVLKSPRTRLYCDSRGVMVGTGELWLGAIQGPDGTVSARVTAVNSSRR
jgi:RNA polymerase sigma factor (sigma-70 family)